MVIKIYPLPVWHVSNRNQTTAVNDVASSVIPTSKAPNTHMAIFTLPENLETSTGQGHSHTQPPSECKKSPLSVSPSSEIMKCAWGREACREAV